ncbi:MAG: phage tail tape measure protein, partial [Candidatus Kapaibacterium sp.]
MADFKLRGQVELNFSPNKGVSAIAAQIRKELGGSIPVDLAVRGVNAQSIDPIKNKIREAVRETENLGKGMSSSIERNTQKAISSYRSFTSEIEKETKKLNKTVNLFDSFVGGISTRFAQFAKFAIASAGVQKIVQAIDYGFDAIIKINSAQIKLQQITGNTAAEVNRFSSSILQLSRNVGVASTDLLEASDTLAQAGFGLKTIQGLMKSLANTQLVPTFGNLEKTTEGVVSAISQFRLLDVNGSTKNVDKFLSTLNTLSKKYAVEASNIIEGIKSAGGVFAASEGILSEDALGLGKSTNANKNLDTLRKFAAITTSIRSTTRLPDTVISTGLRTVINRLQDPSVEKKVQEILGANLSLRDTRGEFIGTLEAALKLNKALQDVGSNTATYIEVANAIGGGVRQAKIAIPLITGVADAYEALAEARKGDNSLAKDAELASESLSVKITKIGQDLAAFGTKIAESSGFKIMLDQIRSVTQAVTFLIDTLSPTLQIGFAAGVGSILAPKAYNVLQGTASILRGQNPSDLITRRQAGVVSAIPFMDKFLGRPPVVPSDMVDEIYNKTKRKRRTVDYGDDDDYMGYARGGYVNAMLMPGEIVFSPEEVKQIGLPNLERLNRQGLQGIDSVPAMLPHGSYVLNKNSTRQMAIGGLYDDNLQPLIDENRSKINEFIPTKDALRFLAGAGVKSIIGRSSEVDDRNIISLKTSKDRRFVNSSTVVHELIHHLGLDYEAIKTSGKDYPKHYGRYMFNYLSTGSEVDRNFVKANNLNPENPIHLKFAHLFQAKQGYGLLPLEGATVFAEQNIPFRDLKKILPDTKITSNMIQDMRKASMDTFFGAPSPFGDFVKIQREAAEYFKTADDDLFDKIKAKDYLEKVHEKSKIYNSSLSDPTLLKRRSVLTDYLKSRLPGFANGGFVGTVPGSGNTDSFPTFLAEGSYVLNKRASNMLRGGRVRRMAKGGLFKNMMSLLTTGRKVPNIDEMNMMAAGIAAIPASEVATKPQNRVGYAVRNGNAIGLNKKNKFYYEDNNTIPHEMAHALNIDKATVKDYGSYFQPEREKYAKRAMEDVSQIPRIEGIATFLETNKEFGKAVENLTTSITTGQSKALSKYNQALRFAADNLLKEAEQLKASGASKEKVAKAEQKFLDFYDTIEEKTLRLAEKLDPNIRGNRERITELGIRLVKEEGERRATSINANKAMGALNRDVINNEEKKRVEKALSKTGKQKESLQQQIDAIDAANPPSGKNSTFQQVRNQQQKAPLLKQLSDVEAKEQKLLNRQQFLNTYTLTRKQKTEAFRDYSAGRAQSYLDAGQLANAEDEARSASIAAQQVSDMDQGKLNMLRSQLAPIQRDANNNVIGGGNEDLRNNIAQIFKANRSELNKAGINNIKEFASAVQKGTISLSKLQGVSADTTKFFQVLSEQTKTTTISQEKAAKAAEQLSKIEDQSGTTAKRAALADDPYADVRASSSPIFNSMASLDDIRSSKNKKPGRIRGALLRAGAAIKSGVMSEKLSDSDIAEEQAALEFLSSGEGDKKTRKQARSQAKAVAKKRQGMELRRQARLQKVGIGGLAATTLGSVLASSENQYISGAGSVIANIGGGIATGSQFAGIPGAIAGGIAGAGISIFELRNQAIKRQQDLQKTQLADQITTSVK